MTTNKQSLLIVFAVFGVVGGLIGSVYYFVSDYEGSFFEDAQETISVIAGSYNDGRQYGTDNASPGLCLKETFTRLNGNCESFNCQLDIRLFMQGCLETTPKNESFCENVPSIFDFTDTIEWTINQCKKIAPKQPGCTNLFTEVVKYCQKGGF